MTKSTEIMSAAKQLAPSERLALVEELPDSLDQPDDVIDARWASEAQDRLAAYRRGEIQAVPLSDVLAKYSDR